MRTILKLKQEIMEIILRNAKLSLVALLLCFGFIACDDNDDFNPGGQTEVPDPDPEPTDDDGAVESNNILDFAAANGYTVFVEAAEAAELTGALTGDDELTIFMPTNDAFQALLDSNEDWSALGDIPADVLEQVLMNHVQSGTIMSGDLETGYYTSMAQTDIGGEMMDLSLYINVGDDVMLNGVSTVTDPDNEVDNGVVHVVDQVIGLPDLTTFATADPNFSLLAEALTEADLVGALQAEGPFTVFAPTDDAFQALLDSNDDWTSAADIDDDVLTAVLTYHVIAENNYLSGDLSDGLAVTTLQGQDLTINEADGDFSITDAAGGMSDILEDFVDIQATNGVIHAIDTVLMPDLSGDSE
ncbi:fasciclin domain-containing protein [Gramella sp. BOM4]|nr:fasciclin domain-containing protein [Christiangramia bathymodioli]